jgi:hypothetical protein
MFRRIDLVQPTSEYANRRPVRFESAAMRFGIDPSRQPRNDHETCRSEFPRQTTSGLTSCAGRRAGPNNRNSRSSKRADATPNKQHRGRIDQLRQRPRISRISQWHDSQRQSFAFSQTPLASTIITKVISPTRPPELTGGDVRRQKFKLATQMAQDFSRRHPFAQPNPDGFWLPCKRLLQLQPVESL